MLSFDDTCDYHSDSSSGGTFSSEESKVTIGSYDSLVCVWDSGPSYKFFCRYSMNHLPRFLSMSCSRVGSRVEFEMRLTPRSLRF
jgi:hypothetical protein